MTTNTQKRDSLLSLLKRLYAHVSVLRKRQFFVLLLLTLFSSVAEVVSLGAVLPFIAALTQPEEIFINPYMALPIQIFNIQEPSDLVTPLTLLFIAVAMIAGALRLILLWRSLQLVNLVAADISIEIYLKSLHQPYEVHLERSSSEIISSVTQKVATVSGILVSGVAIITSSCLFVAMISVVVAVDFATAVTAVLGFGLTYFLIAYASKKRLRKNGYWIAAEQDRVVKSLQEGLGAIRDVLLDNTQKVFAKLYNSAILKLQRANAENQFINQFPRYAMETVGMVLIASLVMVLSTRDGGISAALPILGLLALAAQRLLPLMQQLYNSWAVINGSKAALIDVLSLLEQKTDGPLQNIGGDDNIKFSDSLSFSDVSFRYGIHSPWILKKIHLDIQKGETIGVIGPTGSGKSTLINLLMGLLKPTEGLIKIDGKELSEANLSSYRRFVSHVPQDIFIADTTIMENIAFGVAEEDIDIKRVEQAAKRARLEEFIANRPLGYKEIVGEKGVRLSGGQRQRIGIARALYKNARVLVLDEATSALDSATEKEIMATIESLDSNLTVVVIAHRLTTLKCCNRILELEDSTIVRSGSYEQIIGN